MIDTITAARDHFDLQGFIDAYREFYRSWAGANNNPDYSVTVAKWCGDVPMPLCEDRDLVEELTDRGWLLFFQIHDPLADDAALCIDGQREQSEEFDIGVADGYGFLVKVSTGNVNLHPSLYDGSSGRMPSINLQAHCSMMNEELKDVLPEVHSLNGHLEMTPRNTISYQFTPQENNHEDVFI